MLKKLFTREKLIGYGDRITKILVDYLVTLIFAYFAVFSVCGAIPHVAETYSSELLLRYTAFFAAVWNILLSSAAISILTITALFASVAVSVIYYIADPAFQSFVDSYFRWISTLFWKINAADELFEYVTVIAITVFFTLLLTFFATRFSNVWLVLFLIVPFAAYYDSVGAETGVSYFMILVFGLALYYMRLRQSIYLDYRLAERDTVRFGNMRNIVMLPAVLLAALLVTLVGKVPADQYAASEMNLGISARITQFLLETEENLFSGFRSIDYEADRIGINDHQGRFLNNAGVEVLTFESHAAEPRYFYLRSYSYQNYKSGWERKGVLGVEPTESGAPFATAKSELEYARNLVINRALNSYNSTEKDPAFTLRRQIAKDEVRIRYEDIAAKAVFEVPLARQYSILGTKKVAISDDLAGSGLYSPEQVPKATTYSVECFLVTGEKKDFLDYFGDGFFASVTQEEASSIYHGDLPYLRSYAEKIHKNYTSTAGFSDRLTALALRTAGNTGTTYEKAERIASFLRENFKYDSRVYLPEDGSDYAEDFLFGTKTGNDVHFASAAVLLLRAAGIPARYAEGYLALAGGSMGEVSIRQKDEHAWAEIYLEGLGWIPLETVPGKDVVPVAEETDEGADSFLRDLTLRDIGGAVLYWLKAALVFMLRVLLGIVITAVSVLVLLFLKEIAIRLILAHHKGLAGYRAGLCYLLRKARFAGLRRGDGEGLGAFARRVDRLLPEEEKLLPLVDAGYDARYGGRELSAEASERLARLLIHYPHYAKSLISDWKKRIVSYFV